MTAFKALKSIPAATLVCAGLVAFPGAAQATGETSWAAKPCGLHYEASVPVQVWWNNCNASPDLVWLNYAVLPDHDYWVKPYKDEWLGTQDPDNPLGYLIDIKLIRPLSTCLSR